MRASISAASQRQQYVQRLIEGNRPKARELIASLREAGISPREIASELVWPVMSILRERHREGSISCMELNIATRLNRSIADQVGALLPQAARNGKRVLVVCGNAEPEELGGQICADLFEAEGHEVIFVGGSVPDDEVLAFVGNFRPELLILFATLPNQLPAARRLVDYVHEVNCCPEMQILCCGGVYERAEGLAEEIGADLYAPDAQSALEVSQARAQQRASVEQQTVGRTRRTKRAAQRRALVVARNALRNAVKRAA